MDRAPSCKLFSQCKIEMTSKIQYTTLLNKKKYYVYNVPERRHILLLNGREMVQVYIV